MDVDVLIVQKYGRADGVVPSVTTLPDQTFHMTVLRMSRRSKLKPRRLYPRPTYWGCLNGVSRGDERISFL